MLTRLGWGQWRRECGGVALCQEGVEGSVNIGAGS